MRAELWGGEKESEEAIVANLVEGRMRGRKEEKKTAGQSGV